MKIRKEDALEYHSKGRKGKIEVVTTKPCVTQRDLSLSGSVTMPICSTPASLTIAMISTTKP